ncbi:MAG: sulfotransferase family protein [Terriglobia bacterium]
MGDIDKLKLSTDSQCDTAVGLDCGLRSRSPVFIVGGPRSGNNFLYHALLSSGGFVVYRAAPQVYNTLAPKFGDLSVYRNRQKMLKAWLASPYFERTGLDAQFLKPRILDDCRSGGDFLRMVMGEMGRRQNARRWASLSVEELLYMPQIKREIPDALFVHTVRDGRDVSLSLGKKGYVPRLPWDRGKDWWSAAFYWDWIVNKCRTFGQAMPSDYFEIHYEELVGNPPEALQKIGAFIDHDLDYERIQKAAVGTVSDPNTSFGAEEATAEFNPVGRWKKGYSSQELAQLESVIGPRLRDFGYTLESAAHPSARWSHLKKLQYDCYFESRFFIKSKTPLGRLLVNADSLHSMEAFVR